MTNCFVDLGLPSGNLWRLTSEFGYYTANEAANIYKDNLPNLCDLAELYTYCKFKWSAKANNVVCEGPNGNIIFLPANGYFGLSKMLYGIGFEGIFRWISYPMQKHGTFRFQINEKEARTPTPFDDGLPSRVVNLTLPEEEIGESDIVACSVILVERNK